MTPFNRSHMFSYYCFIEGMSLSCTVFKTLPVINTSYVTPVTLGSPPVSIHQLILYAMYTFLFVGRHILANTAKYEIYTALIQPK